MKNAPIELNTLKVAAYTTHRPDIVAMVPVTSKEILDVGCSNGALGSCLKQRTPGARVTGIEFDPAFAATAATHLDDVRCEDLNRFDWSAWSASPYFDCVIFADVLEHLDDPLRHLIGARSLLAPGGCIIVSLPNIRHLSALVSIYLNGTFPRRDRGIFDRTHRHWFTRKDAHDLFVAAQMAVERTSYALRFGDTGGGIVNRGLNKLPQPVRSSSLVSEFLTYQFCFKAVIA